MTVMSCRESRWASVISMFLSVLVISAAVADAAGNSFDKVRYNGGTLESKVDPEDWNNTLTVTPDAITLDVKDGQLQIPPASVTGLSYGQEAHRRVGTMAALGILVSPIALVGLFHKTRQHFIGIEYTTSDGKTGGVLLQGHKSNYRGILLALKSATGAPLTASEEDRKYIPVGIDAAPAVASDEAPKPVEASMLPSVPAVAEDVEMANLTVVSDPVGGEIHLDGAFVGNTPALLKLSPGQHTIVVTTAGFKQWTREMTAIGGSDLKINAVLQEE